MIGRSLLHTTLSYVLGSFWDTNSQHSSIAPNHISPCVNGRNRIVPTSFSPSTVEISWIFYNFSGQILMVRVPIYELLEQSASLTLKYMLAENSLFDGRELGECSTNYYEEIQKPLGEFLQGGKPMVGLLVSSVLILTLGSLAAGAGVGGGALYVTIFNLLLVKYIKAAVPLSKSTILGAAIGNFMALAYQRHPHADRPKIDYEIATFMQSGELLGVTFGVLLNMLLPDLIIKIFMVLLLTYNSYKTINKGISKYKKETEKMQKGHAEKEVEDGIEETDGKATAGTQESNGAIVKRSMSSDLGSTAASSDNIELTYDMNVVDGSESNATSVIDESSPQTTPEQAAELKKLQEEAAVTFPRWAYVIILSMTAYTIAYALLKQEVFNPCSDYYPVGYWLWYFTPVPVLMLCMYATGLILLNVSFTPRRLNTFKLFIIYSKLLRPEPRTS